MDNFIKFSLDENTRQKYQSLYPYFDYKILVCILAIKSYYTDFNISKQSDIYKSAYILEQFIINEKEIDELEYNNFKILFSVYLQEDKEEMLNDITKMQDTLSKLKEGNIDQFSEQWNASIDNSIHHLEKSIKILNGQSSS